MSDQQYQEFLDRASNNESAQNAPSPKTTAVDYVTTDSVPAVLHSLKADRVYVTEGDEPFRLVSLACRIEGQTPSLSEVADAIGLEGRDVDAASMADFDPQRDYADVVDTVAKAGCKSIEDVKVFKTKGRGVRYDYWIVTASKDNTSLVGYVVTAIES